MTKPKPPPQAESPEQSERFIEMARELEIREDAAEEFLHAVGVAGTTGVSKRERPNPTTLTKGGGSATMKAKNKK